jgi:WD40 repeat protein
MTTIPGESICSLSFDPTGTQLLTGSSNGDASVWSAVTGAMVRVLRRGDAVDQVAWSPDSSLVVTGGHDGQEQVWDVASGRLQSEINGIHDKVSSIEFDPASKLVVAAGANGSIVVSDARLGLLLSEFAVPRTVVKTAHFDSTSTRILTASFDGTSRIWNATPAYRRWTSPPMSNDCGFGAALVPDGRFVAIGCRDRATRVYDTARDRLLAELPSVTHVDDGDFTTAFPAVSSHGDRAAIIRGDAVEIYELPGGQLLRKVDHHTAVSAVAFAPGGHDLISGDVLGGTLMTSDGQAPQVLPPATTSIDAIAILTDGRIVVVDAGKRLRVIGANHRAVLADLEISTRAMLLRPTADSRRLITVPAYTVAGG